MHYLSKCQTVCLVGFTLALTACAGSGGGSSNNTVAAVYAPNPVNGHVGKATTVTVTFTTSDGASASHLTVASLESQLPGGWSSAAANFICESVSVGTGCTLHLQYLPTAIEQGIAELAFSYLANNGLSKTGTVKITYSSSLPALKLLAGSIGSYGNADGAGVAAHFSQDGTVAVDSSGTIFVADQLNFAVRKVTPDGVVTTFAGGNGLGYRDGSGDAVQFGILSAIAIGPGGDVYVADSNYQNVRKIALGGTTTTLVNSDVAPGPNPSGDLSVPYGVAVDAAGYVYVANDWGTILKVAPGGSVTTLAGLKGSYGTIDGVGSAARFTAPGNLAIDPNGNLFVTDRWSTGCPDACATTNAVRRITPSGAVTTIAVSESIGLSGIAATGGDVYVTGANALLKVNAAGGFTTVAGTEGTPGFGDSEHPPVQFSRAEGLAATPDGALIVADNAQIRMASATGIVHNLAGSPGCRPWEACYLPYIAADRYGSVYAVTSRDMFQLVRIDASGAVTSLPRLPSQGPDYESRQVDDIAIDRDGTLYAAVTARYVGVGSPQYVYSWINTLAPNGSIAALGARVENAIYSIAVDAKGNVYAGSESCVYVFAPDGKVSILAGQPGVPGSADGTGSAAQFGAILDGIAVSPTGTIFVSDTNNQTVRQITPAGVVTTAAGQAGSIGFEDGAAQMARFSNPRGLTTDPQGNVFVADPYSYNGSAQYTGPYGSLVRRIGTDGIVSTIVGNRHANGIVPGPLPAYLRNPSRVALRSDGELVIGDGQPSVWVGAGDSIAGGAILVTDGF